MTMLPKIIKSSLLSCTLFALTLGNLVSADDRFKDVEIKPIKLSETTYMFVGSGGNIGVSAGTDGILIIDDQFAPLADKISAALNQIQAGAPKFIINTHYHGDHTGANAHFGKNGTIMAHHNVLKRLASDSKTTADALPVITFEQGITVHFNGDALKVRHMGPGHTDGDSVVIWSNDNIVHMGDLFFKDRFPYIDLNAGGSVEGYRDNVAAVLRDLDTQTKVIPGHGALANKSDLTRFKHMLDASINWMKDQKASGLTLDQLKATGMPEKWKDWSWIFISEEQWIETLYQGL
ncbi:MBL fold metallo-hydrolase [Shewanella sp. Choline-02u-19]|uniref:MBL fold metallo-hydrolase n=1 Tax=unclassified Shewanella TaxID=196818 RepID=UPI000C344AD2|nr:MULTISPECIES: MBL fold metallo-hydrolase [unclassified Shewanella]PKH56130.1 MBL fold metallo-hydrolase [Shewanella sp. Bg11-22]PKI27285.1 MBL fold metallo-hydrolase [Shewanella sp. Choline-02u-19]